MAHPQLNILLAIKKHADIASKLNVSYKNDFLCLLTIETFTNIRSNFIIMFCYISINGVPLQNVHNPIDIYS